LVEDMSNYSLGCRIATGPSKGDYALIPRVTFLPNDHDPSPVRFPLRLSFAMTINKSQGQTFSKVGLHLSSSIFSHGQLYVALSRAMSGENVKIKTFGGKRTAENVVFKEIIQIFRRKSIDDRWIGSF